MGEPVNYLGTLQLCELIREDLLERDHYIVSMLHGGCPTCRADAEALLYLAGWTRVDFYDALKAHRA